MIKSITTILIVLIFCFYCFGSVGAEEPVNSEESVREKVKEKIQEVLKKPKAYLGTITDKTEDTLQIKNLKGEIQFVSVNTDEITLISSGNNPKEINYDEVGLGDFIIAMGFQKTDNTNQNNGTSVLDAKRILVTEEVKPTNRSISFGRVIEIEKKTLTLDTNGAVNTFEFPRSWKGPEINEISENDRVAIVSIFQEGKVIIRTIEITKKTQPSPTTEESE